MATESLKQKTTKGLFWSSVERFSNQGVSFIFSIILARLLSPSDFGIIAMITIFFAFYNQPILSPIIRITGLEVILNSLCVVQQALFTIKIDFKSQAKVTLSATVLSGIVGIILAYQGYGVWALVWQGVVSAVARMGLLWLMSTWYPRTGFSKDSFHYLFGYGSKLLASGLLDTIYNNIYPIVIGKFYTPVQLGNYSRALSFAQLPSSNITSILQRVTFPVLSTIHSSSTSELSTSLEAICFYCFSTYDRIGISCFSFDSDCSYFKMGRLCLIFTNHLFCIDVVSHSCY